MPIIHAKEKKERALGEKLFLKAHRCSSPKCSMVRRPYRPGVHGKKRRKLSDYGTQLLAKQKLKAIYGVTEAQLASVFKKASRTPEATGEKMIELLERRLDSTLFRSGLAGSRPMARNIVSRGHITVNGRKMTIPSYSVRSGDEIGVRLESQETAIFREAKDRLQGGGAPTWLSVNADEVRVKVAALPKDADLAFDTSGVIEFFAKNN